MENKLNNDKRLLKEHRVKMYFMEAAREMIINEGVESVSVRKVANQAGYSYATLYNHFDNLDELLWYTRDYMINVLIEHMHKENKTELCDIQGVKNIFKSYISYFLQYPNIFTFFFSHQLNKPSQKYLDARVKPNYDEMFKNTFRKFITEGKFSIKEIEVIGKTINFAVHGMLTIYISNKDNMTKESLYLGLDDMVNHLLK